MNEHFDVFPQNVREYLREFAGRYSDRHIIEALRSLRGQRVLVVGDAIIDEYHYTTSLGRPGKGGGLAVSFESVEQFAGGAIAVANHLGEFCDDVTLATGIGHEDGTEHFIRSHLVKTVEPAFFRSANSTTLVKRRFVDEDFNRLFEVYLREGKDYDPAVDSAASRWLERELPQFDLVVVPDFGNGFISDDMVETLCEHARFLAVNTQINSGNRGFHVINRYRRADLVSLNEPELRLAAHDRANSVDRIAEMLAGRVNARVVAVTMGTAGVRMCERESGEYVQVPALSTKVVDRIGAGDAFLSLAALCVGGGLPADLAAFVGSAAAAIDVQIVCNRSPVTSAGLFRYITTLLKWPTNTSIEAAARPGRRPETLAPRPEWLVPRIRRLVSSWNRRDRRVVLFGAGEVTSCLFKWTNITEANLVAIAEPAATLQGKKIWNLETVAPEAIRELSADTVLVCSNDSSGEIRRALASLEQDGFEVVSLRPTSNSGRKRKTIRAGTSAFVS